MKRLTSKRDWIEAGKDISNEWGYGRAYPKKEQVARCGNAVPPQFATALARANAPEWCAGKKITTMAQWIDHVAV